MKKTNIQKFFSLAFIAFTAIASAQPTWLNPEPQKPQKPKTIRIYDTITKLDTIIKLDTITKLDTIIKLDTINPPNYLYNYKLSVCNIDANNMLNLKIDPFDFNFYKDVIQNMTSQDKLYNCYFSKTTSDSSYSINYGNEELRNIGYIFDNYGNKLEQKEKLLSGIQLIVTGENASFDYFQNKKVMIKSKLYKNEVNFLADYLVYEKRCYFWIFCNIEEKKDYIIVNLTREKLNE